MRFLHVYFRWLWFVCLLGSLVFTTKAQNRVLELEQAKAYLDLGTSSDLKPAEAISFFLWAYHTDWQQITNRPTLLGNTQHVGFALSLTIDQVRAWISIDSVYQNVDVPIALLRPGWHHFGVIFNGQEIMFLLDGMTVDHLILPQKYALNQPDSSVSLMIGAETTYNRIPDPDLFFSGLIDEILIFDRSLTIKEARYIYEGMRERVDSDGLLLDLPFEGTFLDQSPLRHQVETVNQPEIIEKRLPSRWLAKNQPGFFAASLFIAVGILLWLVRSFKKHRSYWIIGVWGTQFFIYALADPYWLSQIGIEIFPDIWRDSIMDFLMIGSLLVFLKTFFAINKKYFPSWIWMSCGLSLMAILILPVQFRGWFLILGNLVAAYILFSGSIDQKQPLLFMLSLALLLSAVLMVLELMNVLDIYTFTTLNNPLSFALFGVGLYPLIHYEQVKPEVIPMKDPHEDLLKLLTPKEAEVCRLLLDGKTDSEIADILQVSANTIKTYNKRIYAKLGVSGRRELVILAKV